MNCPACRKENPAHANFCLECGRRLALTCSQCGTELPLDAKFCAQCGHPAGRRAEQDPRFAAPGAYTPRHLAEQILNSRGALEGERKQVTVLFADLKGSMELLADRDPEDARKILDPVLQRMMDMVHRYEGTVNQVMGDGIMALFGAPIAHEDHAVRACYAALAMQESVRRYAEDTRRSQGVPVHIRVGLNSGEVVVRSVGSDLRMDYTAVGQTSHLAARMEQLAMPGSTALAPDTLALAEGYVQVKPLGPVPVQGLTEPVEVYELVGAGLARSRLQAAALRGLTRFVGRDAEMDTLRHALDQARSGHGEVVAVVGEPGVGKSRLVYELTHSHRTHEWLVLEAGSVSYGKATPYLPVTDLLKSYFRIDPQDDERRIREKVAGKVLTLDEALRSYLPAYLTLLAVPADDSVWRDMDPTYRRRQTLEAVKRLLLRESQVQPLLIVFEDLHWIDDETQALLDSLVDSIPSARALLLVNYRPEYGHGWVRKTYYSQVRLDPLRTESAEELLGALLGDDPGVAALKALLIGRTEGNPFFLEESVRTLVETGVLAGERGAYRLGKPADEIQVPATVQAMLAARIDRLPPSEKRLLQRAAVIGKDVPYALLQAIAEEPETTVREALAHLQAAEFLYEASLFPELEYTFKHALTHEVAYGSLLQDTRRALHGQALEAMERLYAGWLADQVEQLAQHAVRSERWAQAVAYLREASAKAVARAAYGDAVRLLEQALEAQEELDPADNGTRCDLLLVLTDTLALAGEPQRAAEQVAEEAFALAEATGDRDRAARACTRAQDSLRRYGSGTITRGPLFTRWTERLDHYAVLGTRERVAADRALWNFHQSQRDWTAARALQVRQWQQARALGDPDVLFVAAHTYLLLAAPHYQHEALPLVDELLARPREGVRSQSLGAFLLVAQGAYLVAGDRDRAEALWSELDALAARTQDPVDALGAIGCEGVRAMLDGELEEAIRVADRMRARGKESGSQVLAEQDAGHVAFWPSLYLGRADEAVASYGRLAELAGVDARGGLGYARFPLAVAHAGRSSEARQELAAALAWYRISPEEDEVFSLILSDLLCGAVVLEDREAVALLAGRLSGLTADRMAGLRINNVARALGRAAVLLGDPTGARANYERSLEWATRLRHRPEVALTRLELAELLLEEAVSGKPSAVSDAESGLKTDKLKAEGLAHLDFAIEELSAMNMQTYLDRALSRRALLNGS